MPEGKPYSRSAPPPAGKGQDRGISLGATHSRGSVVFSPPEPCVGGMDLEAPGCGWCVLPTVLPGGPLPARRLSRRQPRLLTVGLPQHRMRGFMGSMCLLDINVRSVTQSRGGSRCPGSVTAGFKWSDVCSGCWWGRMLLRSPLEASIVNSFIVSKSPLSRGRWGRSPRGPGLVVDTSALLCTDYSLGQPVFQSPLTLPLKSGYFSQESAQQKGLHKDTHVHNHIVCDSNSNDGRDKMKTVSRGAMLF